MCTVATEDRATENMATENMATESDTGTRKHNRRPSGLLLIAGIVALLVSGWALLGPSSFEGFDANVGWVLVAVAVLVGAVLVLTPSKKGS